MTIRFNIQEQVFEVYDDIYHKLDINETYDPIIYNKYLDNFRMVKTNKNQEIILRQIQCYDIILCSKKIVKIDISIYELLNIDRIEYIDDGIFIDFCFSLRMNLKYDIKLANYLMKNQIYHQPNNILSFDSKK